MKDHSNREGFTSLRRDYWWLHTALRNAELTVLVHAGNYGLRPACCRDGKETPSTDGFIDQGAKSIAGIRPDIVSGIGCLPCATFRELSY